ncbi:P-loop NTPase family protein [Herbaspirillum autotrophicum]|uniref:hypothetical protein n=1 Tax=Herbaspirillum autotrophicum TaxID=180195 RepID=UPI00067B7DAC|nr:hypothetical protein [Herbaspirillum autotrophicum]
MNSFQYSCINIVGAPGSGTTTRGHALASRLNIHFEDADGFYWKPSNPPFSEKYDPGVRLTMLLESISGYNSSVIAGSVCGWGTALEESFDLVVFFSLPTALRLQRIEAREIALFCKANPEFLAWAAQYDEGRLPGRSRARHEAWLASRRCPVLMLESDQTVDDRVEEVIRFAAQMRESG